MMLTPEESTRAPQNAVASVTRPALQDELLTVSEAAALLKVPMSWVYERTRRRGLERIPHFKLGKYLRFSQRELLDWLERIRRN
jgi:excisionase family DNA binding protein